jgi:hypothetical protein
MNTECLSLGLLGLKTLANTESVCASAKAGRTKKEIKKIVLRSILVRYEEYFSSEETVLLKNVVDAETNKLVADHVWFSYTKGFEKITLTEGLLLEFEARVKEYKKGYVNKAYKINNSTIDYKLSHPTKIKKMESDNIV